MGIKLLILLALLIGVLYCFHILAQDYQAIAGSKILRLLFKRDLKYANVNRPTVRWRKILHFDPLQCARYMYCELGAREPDDEMQRDFIYMLTLNANEEDEAALEEFKTAYFNGRMHRGRNNKCKQEFYKCPFKPSLLFDILRQLIHIK